MRRRKILTLYLGIRPHLSSIQKGENLFRIASSAKNTITDTSIYCVFRPVIKKIAGIIYQAFNYVNRTRSLYWLSSPSFLIRQEKLCSMLLKKLNLGRADVVKVVVAETEQADQGQIPIKTFAFPTRIKTLGKSKDPFLLHPHHQLWAKLQNRLCYTPSGSQLAMARLKSKPQRSQREITPLSFICSRGNSQIIELRKLWRAIYFLQPGVT